MKNVIRLLIVLVLFAWVTAFSTLAEPAASHMAAETDWSVSSSDSIADHGDPSVIGGLAYLVSRAGSEPCSIRVPGPQVYAIGSNLTIPVNIGLSIEPGAILQVAFGKTIIIKGSLRAGPYRVFSGAGVVTFGEGGQSGWAEWFGAVGDWDGTIGTDNTLALQKFFASGLHHFKFGQPGGRYRISLPVMADLTRPKSSVYLASLEGRDGIVIEGNNCTIEDPQIYKEGTFNIIFGFDACSNVKISGVGYVGHMQDVVLYHAGAGAIFVYIVNGGQFFDIDATIVGMRYGIYSGEYNNYVKGNARDISINLSASYVGYPLALWYSGHNTQGTIVCDTVRRAAYIGGVDGVNLRVYAKNFYTQIAVVITQARSGEASAQGSKNLDIAAIDTGTTKPQEFSNSYLIGIVPSFLPDAEHCWPHEYSNIKLRFSVVSTDVVARNVGGLVVNPSYQTAEAHKIMLRGIQISGSLDSSAQTIASTKYPFFLNGGNSGKSMNFSRIVLRDITLLKGGSTVLEGRIVMRGLRDVARLENVYSTYQLVLATNYDSKCLVVNSKLRSTSSPLQGGIGEGNIMLSNSQIQDDSGRVAIYK
jgi:hypothetical protein